MSVLVECFSVVVRCSAIERRYPGGMAGYRADCTNKTLCTDGNLVRVGFMAEADIPEFLIRVLSRAGLASTDTDVPGATTIAADCIAVIEQGRGPWHPEAATWLEYAQESDGVCLCWLSGEPQGELAAPAGWTPGGPGTFVKLAGVPEGKPVRLLGHEPLPPVQQGYVRLFTASVYGTKRS